MPAEISQSGGGRTTLVGQSSQNSAKFCNYSDSGPFHPQNFHRNFIFPIIKFVPAVPANSEHAPASSEYFSMINSSNFMLPKNIPVVFYFSRKKLHLFVFRINQVDVILAGKDIASVFSKVLPDASVQTMCHYALVKAVEPFKLHPMSMSYIYELFEHLLRLWIGKWLHIHIIITTDTSPDLWELAEILPDASVQTMHHYALVEAVEPFKLHPTSIWHIYDRFEHFLRLWMGIWLHTHIVTTTDTSPDLG